MTEDAISRARACVGTRFRPQGRSVEHGLDCVGVVMVAWGLPAVAARGDYRLRQRGFDGIEAELAMFFAAVPVVEAGAGDVLLVDAGRGQPHVIILTPDGYLHADAGTRKCVEVPGAVPWPVRSAWRYANMTAPSPRSPSGKSPLQPGSGVRSAPGTPQIVPGARSAPAPGSNPLKGRG